MNAWAPQLPFAWQEQRLVKISWQAQYKEPSGGLDGRVGAAGRRRSARPSGGLDGHMGAAGYGLCVFSCPVQALPNFVQSRYSTDAWLNCILYLTNCFLCFSRQASILTTLLLSRGTPAFFLKHLLLLSDR